VEVAELRALDVPVVLAELVVQHVRRREVRVQRVDYLFGLLLVDAEALGALDVAGVLEYVLLGAHCIRLFAPDPLKVLPTEKIYFVDRKPEFPNPVSQRSDSGSTYTFETAGFAL